MNRKPNISEDARRLYDSLHAKSWATSETLAKGIKVRKERVTPLLDELERARLIDIHFLRNGRRSNPKRLIHKVKNKPKRSYTSLLNAINIGFRSMSLDRNSVIEIYLKYSVPVVPFEPFGKKPTISFASWQNFSLETKLNYFFDRPGLNIGMRVPWNLCVVDLDSKLQVWEDLPAFKETLSVSTGRGFHYYFLADAVVNTTRAGVLPQVDTRCKGSFVVIPPSRHKNGALYEWKNPAKYQQLPIEFRREWRKAYFALYKSREADKFKGTVIPKGERNDTLWRHGRSLRARGLSFIEIEEEIQITNTERCSPRLSTLEVNRLVKHIWEHQSRNY